MLNRYQTPLFGYPLIILKKVEELVSITDADNVDMSLCGSAS
ncbi:MAG: hypothetical protein ABI472_17420 [Ginsengibacter sp.]